MKSNNKKIIELINLLNDELDHELHTINQQLRKDLYKKLSSIVCDKLYDDIDLDLFDKLDVKLRKNENRENENM
jgi:hypothetical protein